MIKFIEVHDVKTGKPILINVDHVIDVKPYDHEYFDHALGRESQTECCRITTSELVASHTRSASKTHNVQESYFEVIREIFSPQGARTKELNQ